MSDIELLREISDKMDKLLRLQALAVVKGIPEEQSKIELLDSLGFRPIDIAKLLNKTPENISVVPSGIRKKKGEKKTKPTDKSQPVAATNSNKPTAATISQSDMEASKK